MRTTFQQRLDGLEAKLGQMGQVLRSQLDRTLTALATADADVADEVIRRDRLLDADYVEVEEEILRTLALEAPVAKDLRLVAGVLHVNSHIERMGDLCVNMARFVKLAGRDQPVDIGEQVVFIVTGEVRELVPPKAVRAQLER